jgi:hypothetical protein
VTKAELLDRAIAVAVALHQDDLHRIEANKFIEGTAEYVGVHSGTATVNGFLTPLKLASIGAVQDAPANWFGTENNPDAVYVEVKFQDANRVQILPGT